MLKAKQYKSFFSVFLFIGIFIYESIRMVYIPLPPKGGIFFYSNQQYPLQRVVTTFLQKAEKSIWIECFMITDPVILKKLEEKSSLTRVEIYHHQKHPHVFSRLSEARITPSPRSALMHKKLVMIDEEYFLIGSTNLTETSLLMHENVMIGFHHPAMATSIRNKEPFFKAADFTLYGLPGGKKAFLHELLSLIDKAQESIYVVMFCLSHDQIIKALERAQNRGVDVQVIIDGHTYDAKLESFFPTFKLKEKHLMHHKFALIDGTTLLFGSANWTQGGLSKNEEYEIIFYKGPKTLLDRFQKLFKTLRKKGQKTTIIPK